MSQSEQPFNYKPKFGGAEGKIPALKQVELDFMRTIEAKNRERALKLQKLKRRNALTATALGASVLGIYIYSIVAIKQETFLDDFNEPAKVLKE